MLDIIDGRSGLIAADVRSMRRGFPRPKSQYWLNLALYVAVTADRPGIAYTLIGEGANVNARPDFPILSANGIAMVKQGWRIEATNENFHGSIFGAQMTQEKHFPPTVPMLEQAASCSHIATLKVLLAHGASMYPNVTTNQNGSKSGLLPDLIVNHNEALIEILLDHGYDPCRDFPVGRNPQHLTDVTLAKRVELSPRLARRLAALSAKCQAPEPGSP